jgi:hypothetical protein
VAVNVFVGVAVCVGSGVDVFVGVNVAVRVAVGAAKSGVEQPARNMIEIKMDENATVHFMMLIR